MGSAWLCLLCLAASGLILPGTAEPVLGLRPAESLPGQSREETELVEALQEVLEKLGSPEPPAVEKRLSWVPSCEPGEPCAVRRGGPDREALQLPPRHRLQLVQPQVLL
ncbi:unnamed protein product, partial [Bubo scandiacus]